MRACLLLSVLALVLLLAEAKKAPRQNEAESWSHSSKKYSKDHQKAQHFEHKKEVPEVNEAEPLPKQAPLEVPEPEIELQGHLEKSHKVLAEENEKDLHLQDLAYEEKRHKKQEKKKSEKKLFVEQEETALHSADEKVIEDSFEPLEQQQEKPKKNKKQKEEKKKHKEDKKHNKKAHEKNNKDKQKKNGKKYNKKEHKKY